MTSKQLTHKIRQVNEILGYPLKAKANVNTYYIGKAYGGYRIEQISNEGGGCRDISDRGTKRECYIFANGMLEALRSVKR